jgi:hypothetical protein
LFLPGGVAAVSCPCPYIRLSMSAGQAGAVTAAVHAAHNGGGGAGGRPDGDVGDYGSALSRLDETERRALIEQLSNDMEAVDLLLLSATTAQRALAHVLAPPPTRVQNPDGSSLTLESVVLPLLRSTANFCACAVGLWSSSSTLPPSRFSFSGLPAVTFRELGRDVTMSPLEALNALVLSLTTPTPRLVCFMLVGWCAFDWFVGCWSQAGDARLVARLLVGRSAAACVAVFTVGARQSVHSRDTVAAANPLTSSVLTPAPSDNHQANKAAHSLQQGADLNSSSSSDSSKGGDGPLLDQVGAPTTTCRSISSRAVCLAGTATETDIASLASVPLSLSLFLSLSRCVAASLPLRFASLPPCLSVPLCPSLSAVAPHTRRRLSF